MSPEAFAQVGGTLLRELGMQKTATGTVFSLRKFITNWDSYVSPGAKQALFSPQHLKDIEDIVGLGRHLGGALKATNTSKTAGTLILWDASRRPAKGHRSRCRSPEPGRCRCRCHRLSHCQRLHADAGQTGNGCLGTILGQCLPRGSNRHAITGQAVGVHDRHQEPVAQSWRTGRANLQGDAG